MMMNRIEWHRFRGHGAQERVMRCVVQSAASTVSSRRSTPAVRASTRWSSWKKLATGDCGSAAASRTTTASSAVRRASSTFWIAPVPGDAGASSTYRHCATSFIRARKTSPATWKPPTAASQVRTCITLGLYNVSLYLYGHFVRFYTWMYHVDIIVHIATFYDKDLRQITQHFCPARILAGSSC